MIEKKEWEEGEGFDLEGGYRRGGGADSNVGSASVLCPLCLCAQVITMTAKCGESNAAATQLQVVKALLTYVTGGCEGEGGGGSEMLDATELLKNG